MHLKMGIKCPHDELLYETYINSNRIPVYTRDLLTPELYDYECSCDKKTKAIFTCTYKNGEFGEGKHE